MITPTIVVGVIVISISVLVTYLVKGAHDYYCYKEGSPLIQGVRIVLIALFTVGVFYAAALNVTRTISRAKEEEARVEEVEARFERLELQVSQMREGK